MNPAALALRRAEVGIAARLEELLDEQPVRWSEVAALGAALAAIVGATAPGAGGKLLTSAEMAEALGVSSRTVRRKRKAGELTPALKLGAGARARVRWAAP